MQNASNTRRPGLIRGCLFTLAGVAVVTAAPAPHLPTAAFPFVSDDTSLEGAMHGRRADGQARPHRLDTALRDMLAASGGNATNPEQSR